MPRFFCHLGSHLFKNWSCQSRDYRHFIAPRFLAFFKADKFRTGFSLYFCVVNVQIKRTSIQTLLIRCSSQVSGCEPQSNCRPTVIYCEHGKPAISLLQVLVFPLRARDQCVFFIFALLPRDTSEFILIKLQIELLK